MLEPPDLDDRRYQDLVDDAKRHIQRRCPAWTSHNVSDPGVTLIETFAYMVDQLLYRLNRVPDRLHVTFLDLLGVPLHPARAARVPITFWLSAANADAVEVPAGVEVATARVATQEPVSFRTVRPLVIGPCEFSVAVALGSDEAPTGPAVTSFGDGTTLQCFGAVPEPGQSVAIGLSSAMPAAAVMLRVGCPIAGLGVDPRRPPIVWEAWTGAGWTLCDVDEHRSDDIWGLNRSGDLVLHVPDGHVVSELAGRRAGWLRCRVIETEADQPAYTASPVIEGVKALTVGGTVPADHLELVEGEVLGTSDGLPGQRFALRRGPVIRGEGATVLEVRRPVKGTADATTGDGADDGDGAPVLEEWTEVSTFAHSGPRDRHFMLDRATGEIRLGPEVRLADGTRRRYGDRPPHGSVLRVRGYAVGGGVAGNVEPGALTRLKSAVPLIASVENRSRAAGGVDPETLEEAKRRVPLALHARDRAVTAEDFEYIARSASPSVARVRCVPVEPSEAGGSPAVRVLVVPKPPRPAAPLTARDLLLDARTLDEIAEELDRRRVVGTRVLVAPPRYHPVMVLARLRPRLRAEVHELEAAALAALYGYFDPVGGGPDGAGWPFGHPVLAGEAHAVLQRVPGIRMVEEIRLIPIDFESGQPGEHTQRIDIGRDDLVVSHEHQVKLEGA